MQVTEEPDDDEQSDEDNEQAGSSMLMNDSSSENEDVKSLIEQYLNWEKRMKESKKVKESNQVTNCITSLATLQSILHCPTPSFLAGLPTER